MFLTDFANKDFSKPLEDNFPEWFQILDNRDIWGSQSARPSHLMTSGDTLGVPYSARAKLHGVFNFAFIMDHIIIARDNISTLDSDWIADELDIYICANAPHRHWESEEQEDGTYQDILIEEESRNVLFMMGISRVDFARAMFPDLRGIEKEKEKEVEAKAVAIEVEGDNIPLIDSDIPF